MRIWLMAARPRTLPAAIAPVVVGTALAGFAHVFHPLRFIAALIGAIFIQVGTNLSNDYSDARRGADTEDRLGPVRVTAGGLVPPRAVLLATYLRAGKRTLAVRLGRDRARKLFAAIVYLAYLLAPVTWVFGPLSAWLLLPWLTLPLAAPVVRVVRNRTDGPSLNRTLARTGML